MMWDAVERSAAGKTVVLTTHAMDECEALCERVGMMAEASCAVSDPRNISRNGSGYAVDIKIAAAGRKSDANADARVADETFAEMAAAAPDGTGANDRTRRREGEDSRRGPRALAAAFVVGERRRAEGALEHYAVTQSSLEGTSSFACASDASSASSASKASRKMRTLKVES